ncbi:MAG: hypothetical protein IT198_16400 [Acidimicrobiia bacterium]|nr:hypothetical protein [Acidimicrobiia bacterium]
MAEFSSPGFRGVGAPVAVTVAGVAKPPGPRETADVASDPVDVPSARAALHETAAELGDRIGVAVARWVVDSVASVLDAWGGADTSSRARALEEAARAGARAADEATQRIAAIDVESVSRPGVPGPLEVLTDLYGFPSAVLAEVGVPPVVRDDFEVRSFPADPYGLRPRSFRDLPGGEHLADLHLRWGVAKTVLVLAARGSGDAAEPDE